MKFAVTEINESRNTVVVEADSEAEAFDNARSYESMPFAEHSVTQKRFEIRPVKVVDDAQVIEGTATEQ
jgi:predicted RNA-binding protein